MAVDWIAAGKAAAEAAKAFYEFLQGRKEAAERERTRELMLAAINKVRDDVLDRLDDLERAQLQGELEGFRLIYDSYRPDPADPQEENRLVALADDSARVLGRLGAHLDNLPGAPDVALDVWAVYVPLLYLRAQALAERQATYGADQTSAALLSFELAGPRLAALLALLRSRSDANFGPIVCKPIPDSQDAKVCWYTWRRGSVADQFVCGSLRDPKGIEKCQNSRTRNMDIACRATPGVREITTAAAGIEQARDALDTSRTLDLLATHGVSTEVTLVRGSFALAESRFTTDAAGQAAPANDELVLLAVLTWDSVNDQAASPQQVGEPLMATAGRVESGPGRAPTPPDPLLISSP